MKYVEIFCDFINDTTVSVVRSLSVDDIKLAQLGSTVQNAYEKILRDLFYVETDHSELSVSKPTTRRQPRCSLTLTITGSRAATLEEKRDLHQNKTLEEELKYEEAQKTIKRLLKKYPDLRNT